MVTKYFGMMICVTLVILAGVTACGTNPEINASTTLSSSATGTPAVQMQADGKGVVVEVTPMSDTELAAQPTGQSEAHAATGDAGIQAAPQTQTGQPPQGAMNTYANSDYTFSVDHPSDFVFRTQTAEKRAVLEPRPAASFIFMNPKTASSSVPDEPADLEIRVYAAEQTDSLDSWLIANKLVPSDGTAPPKPFQTAHASGVQVCASTMIAPGCSYFFKSNDRIYQLTPATVAGETMATTFRLMA